MKKQLLLLMLLYASSYCSSINAMSAAQPAAITVFLVLDEEHKYQIPAATVPMLGILQHVAYDQHSHEYFLQGSNLDPAVLKLICDILTATFVLHLKHPELQLPGSGEALLNAITMMLKLPERISPESLLRWSDYLNFTLGIYLATNILLQTKAPTDFLKIIQDLREKETIEDRETIGTISQDAYDTIAKCVFLHSYSIYYERANLRGVPGASPFPGTTKNAYSFSIRDYLNFKPDLIKINFEDIEEGEGIEEGTKGIRIDLSELNLVSLDGLNNIPDIDQALTINLQDNFLSILPAHAFSVAPALLVLKLGANQIREIHPTAFNGLNNLKQLLLGANQLSFIDQSTFQSNRQLRIVELHNNKLHYFYPETFRKLYDMEELNLFLNQFVDIDPTIFKDLLHAKIILQGNPLSEQTKKLILQWNSEHAYERRTSSPGLITIRSLPFIEFTGHLAPHVSTFVDLPGPH